MYKDNKKYANYIKQIENLEKKHNCQHLHIAEEVESHFYEAMTGGKYDSLPEDERIAKIIDNLGEPHESVQSILSGQEPKQAVSRFNFKNCMQKIVRGSRYALAFCLYLVSLVFVSLAVIKLVKPDNTGLFIGKNGSWRLGYFSNVDEAVSEILGYWIIPLAILLCILFYLLTTLLLKKHIKKGRR